MLVSNHKENILNNQIIHEQTTNKISPPSLRSGVTKTQRHLRANKRWTEQKHIGGHFVRCFEL